MVHLSSHCGLFLGMQCWISLECLLCLISLIINAIYKPRKLYKQNKLKTIQNLKAEAELRLLACVHNPRQATGMINILEAYHITKLSPLRVFVLQLVELSGHNTREMLHLKVLSPYHIC